MKELECILKEHAARYRKMEPADAVKLVYQNEFGGGHMIRDEGSCLEYLKREYASVEKDPSAERCTHIGNGILRVNLAALEPGEVEALGQAFLESAAACRGDKSRFLEKLKLLRKLAGEGVFPFGAEALEAYLEAYAAAGYPPVSHSQKYRDAYRPAYRIIKRTI